jgi:YHS domain-containing protein
MTMKRMGKAVLAVGLAATFGLVTYAATAAAGPVNDKCPLKGDAVSADKTSDVTVKLCSAACKEKFDKDPGSFLSKIDKVPNTKCPVDGKAPKDVEGTLTVGFCCGNCKGTFDADPSKYISKVKLAKKK